MPDPLIAVILGIIEGITEFLPVSSTGHLLIAQHWLPRQTDLFNLVIQCGAVIAVLPLFPDRLKQFARAAQDPKARDYLMKVLVAFVITGAGGYIMDKKQFKLPEALTPIAWALLVGGILFLVVEFWLKGRKLDERVSWQIAIAVGLGQLVAVAFPGASRSGTTIIISLVLGLSRPAATEFCFLVGIPTMLAASAWKILKALHHPGMDAPKENWSMIAIASVVAAVVSFIAVKWLLGYVRTHTFLLFGWYRIAVGGILLAMLLSGSIADTVKPVEPAKQVQPAHP